MDDNIKKELQSATLDRLLNHLRKKRCSKYRFNDLAGFVEIVYQNGTERKQKKKVSKFQIQMLERMFMVCLILNGKKNIKSKYFSF